MTSETPADTLPEAKISKGSGRLCDESLERALEAFAMVVKVTQKGYMNGLVLVAGVISACVSVVALLGGLIMLFLAAFVDRDTTEGRDYASVFFTVAACFYLGLAALFGLWIPPVCWIFLGPIALVLGFLIVVMLSFEDNEEESCGS